MKFTPLALAALLPLALGAPAPADADLAFDDTPSAALAERALEKRAITGYVDADALKYRRCPRTTSSCDAVGQYPRGTRLSIECYTSTSTTVVNGDARWGKLTNGYWVSLYYVNWSGGIPHC